MIRYAKKSDIPELALLYEELDESQAMPSHSSVGTAGRRMQIDEELTEHTVRYVVKEMNQEIIAFAKLVLQKTAPDDHTAQQQRIVQITDMAVKNGYRNRQIGSELIEHIELIAQGFGAENLVLQIMQVNTAARDFYRKQGFASAVEVMQKELCARRWSEWRGGGTPAEEGQKEHG